MSLWAGQLREENVVLGPSGDVGASPQIHAVSRALAAERRAVVVISWYLPVIVAISDPILMARGGRIVEEMTAAQVTEEKIMYDAIH